jgi:hypothetical protein
MAGIEHTYKLTNPELFDNWQGTIDDWGSLYMLNIWLPNGNKYAGYWCKTLRSAKIIFTKEMGIKGAIWSN